MAAIRTHVTYANVMATIAVFGVLGGTAWAINANSVGSKQLKPNSVKASETAANSVGSPEVIDDSLTGEDIAESTLGGPTRLSISGYDWVVRTGSLTADYFRNGVAFSAGGATVGQFFGVGLDLPTTLQGVPQRLASIELCYRTEASTLARAFVNMSSATLAEPNPDPVEVIADEGDYTDDNCRTFSPASPVPLGANDYAELEVEVDYSASGIFSVFRTTVNLLPQ